MPVVRIDRLDDPRLEPYRSLSDGELLRRQNRFIAEGRLVVGRLLESGHRVESVLLNDASLRALDAQLRTLPPHVPIYVCATSQFAHITGFNLHRGCLAVAERPADRAPGDVLRNAHLVLVLDGVSDADNVGSAFRNADAFGARVVMSSTCCDPLYRKAIRTSMGSVLRTPFARVNDLPGCLTELKTSGFTIAALTPREDACDLTTWVRQPGQRLALLVGGEGKGLTEEAEAIADVRLRIAMRGGVDSLNLATASGIALFHFSIADPRP